MPQGDYIELHQKRHGFRLDHFERKRKKEARAPHKLAEFERKAFGLKAKLHHKKRHAEKAVMRKTIAMHQQVPLAFTPGSSPLACSVTAPMGLHCAWSPSNLITYCTHWPPRVRSGSCCVSGLTHLKQYPVLVVLVSPECPLTT
jgi:hypothetical protein